jgi:hypothetical protein
VFKKRHVKHDIPNADDIIYIYLRDAVAVQNPLQQRAQMIKESVSFFINLYWDFRAHSRYTSFGEKHEQTVILRNIIDD